MEVDLDTKSVDSSGDSSKFENLKGFVAAAREFENTHNESSVNLLNRYLTLIASSCDLSLFSPGRSEVCSFFSALWRLMGDGQAPHWACVAVLSRACKETGARYALTHTYKFMPILARLLSNNITALKKEQLLTVMEDITYGIKISWQESYLSGLMTLLTSWITKPEAMVPNNKVIAHKSLTILVNLCYGNLPAVYTLMRTVDTKEFVVHLINLKDGMYGGIEVCRLLACLSSTAPGTISIRQADVHSFLCCTLKTFRIAIVETNATKLLRTYTFMNDLCTDSNLKHFVLTYNKFNAPIREAIEYIPNMSKSPSDESDADSISTCLQYIFKFLTVLVNLDLYTLRSEHGLLLGLCVKGSRLCLPEALELFAAIVSNYKDEGRLPQELISEISDGLAGLLVPPAIDPGQAGLPWIQVVEALSESPETQERVSLEVSPTSFEDILHAVLRHADENGALGWEAGQQAALVGCKVGLTLAPLRRDWEDALHRILAHHQVRKFVCAGLTSSNGTRRRQVLQLIKHHFFPSDQINQIFGETAPNVSDGSTEAEALRCNSRPESGSQENSWNMVHTLTQAQEDAIDQLLVKLNVALDENKISDIATSSIMELYGYKIMCLEQRLHSHTVALEGAATQTAALQAAAAQAAAAAARQHQVLFASQTLAERNKKTIEELQRQLEDAEVTVRGFRAKLAAERLEKDNQLALLKQEMKAQMAIIENEVRAREKEAEERLKQSECELKAMQKKLEQQTSKNSELAGVLVKFEERVKQRDKKLEEAANSEVALRRDMDLKDATIKQLEKTVLERENRLFQVSAQLEEMKRVQEMVAKLMSKGSAPS